VTSIALSANVNSVIMG